jgi:hypothetical protein
MKYSGQIVDSDKSIELALSESLLLAVKGLLVALQCLLILRLAIK